MNALPGRVLAFAVSVVCSTALLQAADLQAGTARPRIHFEPTTGEGRFVTRGAGYSLHVGPAESVLLLSPERPTRGRHRPDSAVPVALRLRLDGANAEARAEASERLPGKSHYFRGADRSAWRRDVAHFGRVTYREVYPGTDVTYYGNEGALEHDFVVSPGADPGRIRLEVVGATSVGVDAAGDMVLATPLGEVRQKAPIAFQVANGQRVAVACPYVLLDDRRVGFDVGPYDAQRPLVIDPVLTYSTFLGGTAEDDGLDVTVAPDGTLWYVGTTFSSDLPSAVNDASGDQDAFVSHFARDGRTLLSTTYIGGGSADVANRAKATTSGVFLAGGTVSADFPSPDAACPVCRNPPAGLQSWELYYPPSDGQTFLVKLDAQGALAHAAVFGSDRLDNAWVLGLDGAGRPYVGGNSCGDGFPTTPGAYRTSRTPAADPFNPDNECDVTVVRFTQTAGGFTLDYGAYLGGSGADFVAGLAVTPAGAAWVAGGTTSGDFPTTAGARQATHAGDYDAFVARIAPGGGSLPYSTFLGGSAYDYPFDVALDGEESAYVVGRTESNDFPTTPGAFQQGSGSGSDGWVAKLASSGSLQWCTRLGGSGFDWPFAIAVSPSGSSYVAGHTDSPDFPTRLPAQAGFGGDADAFVSRLSPSGSRLTWSTYLGGQGWDGSHGLARVGQGGVWVAGTSWGGLAPTLDATQPDFGGVADGFLVRLEETASVRVVPRQLTFARPRVGQARAPRQVRVLNDGDVPLDIHGAGLGGADARDFTLSSRCPETLEPGESCLIGVALAPATTGARRATLLVDTSAAGAPTSVALIVNDMAR